MSDPVYTPLPVLACVVPGCVEPVTAQLILVNGLEEHDLPVCATHHLEYSQPGHLKHLKTLAGLDREGPHEPLPEGPLEPGPEIIKPTRRSTRRA